DLAGNVDVTTVPVRSAVEKHADVVVAIGQPQVTEPARMSVDPFSLIGDAGDVLVFAAAVRPTILHLPTVDAHDRSRVVRRLVAGAPSQLPWTGYAAAVDDRATRWGPSEFEVAGRSGVPDRHYPACELTGHRVEEQLRPGPPGTSLLAPKTDLR